MASNDIKYDEIYNAYIATVNTYEDNGYNELDAVAVASACHTMAVHMAEVGCLTLASTWEELRGRYTYE